MKPPPSVGLSSDLVHEGTHDITAKSSDSLEGTHVCNELYNVLNVLFESVGFVQGQCIVFECVVFTELFLYFYVFVKWNMLVYCI